MILTNRIIYSNNGTLKDLSVKLLEPYSQTETLSGFVAAEDAIYIGSELPFNHRYFLIPTGNTNAAKVKVEVWDGDEFVEVNDVIDQTDDGTGKAFAQSGIISWNLAQEDTWSREDTNDQGDKVTGLTDVNIKNLYWAKITLDSDPTDITFQFSGYKFSDDEELGIEYPDLLDAEMLDAFKSGKTDWVDQAILATDKVIRDLKRRAIIRSANQVLDWDVFRPAAVHKTAEIIYKSFGDDYRDNKRDARADFKTEVENGILNLDLNSNATLDIRETQVRQGTLSR